MMTFVGRCTFTRDAYENGSERNESHVHTGAHSCAPCHSDCEKYLLNILVAIL